MLLVLLRPAFQVCWRLFPQSGWRNFALECWDSSRVPHPFARLWRKGEHFPDFHPERHSLSFSPPPRPPRLDLVWATECSPKRVPHPHLPSCGHAERATKTAAHAKLLILRASLRYFTRYRFHFGKLYKILHKNPVTRLRLPAFILVAPVIGVLTLTASSTRPLHQA